MKLKVLNIITSLFVVFCIITSCLDEVDTHNYEYSANASITSFSIVDSLYAIYPNGSKTDTLAVYGSDYPFIIDQSKGLIYNADSLPYKTNISKVVVNIIADSYYVYIVAETDSLWESGDSLNFNRPIQFKVMSEKGTFGRNYTANINVHQVDPDTMIWKKTTTNFNPNINRQKAVFANENIYVFADQDPQITVTTVLAKAERVWSELEAIDIPEKADYSSVMVWNDKFYIIANHALYTSTNALNWTKVETEQAIAKLVANVNNEYSKKITGIDTEGYYIESEDGVNWKRYEKLPENFPKGQTSFVSYPLATNKHLSRLSVMPYNELSEDTTTIVWTQMASEHDWIEFTSHDSDAACPKLENQSIIQYNDYLYTFGGPGQFKGSLSAFSKFFMSKDNGISWTPITSEMVFPKEFEELYHKAGGNYSYIVDDKQFIWIMWSQTGEVWRGRINKLGFIKQ